MSSLNRTPRIVLSHSKLGLLGGMPSNRGGIEKHMRSLQRGKSRSFRIPLIPADQRAHAAHIGIEGSETEIARSEVIFLVIERIIGDVHLAVKTAQGSVRVKHGGGVVVDAGGAFLEQRGNEDDPKLLGHVCQLFRSGAGNWFG